MATSIPSLIREYEEFRAAGDSREAAKYAFVIAQRLRLDARMIEAQGYAEECLRLTESLPDSTLDDVTMSETELAGVQLPDLFHEGVVRSRLESLLQPK